MDVELEFTDEIEIRVVATSLSDELGVDHGSTTWSVTGPEFLGLEFTLGTVTPGAVYTRSFHLFGLPEDGTFQQAAEEATAKFDALLADGMTIAYAQHVLPRTVRAQVTVTMSPKETIDHLVRYRFHSEPMQTVDLGMLQTLEEYAPDMAARVRHSLPEGVFPTLSSQEQVVDEQMETQNV